MPQLTTRCGTRLAYRVEGSGPPLVCLPGGPMMDAAYLGDLGGLDADRQLVLLDPRGTGDSEAPSDPRDYRVNKQVPDVEALREHLGLEQLDLLGHSAGANLVYRYVQAHPDRVSSLVLVTPSPYGLGLDVPDAMRATLAASRAHEPWYPAAAAAFARVQDGAAEEADWVAMSPFSYARWDDRTREYDAWMDTRLNALGAEMFSVEDAFDPPGSRAALAALDVPVVVLAGGLDLGNPPGAMAEVAALCPRGELVVQPGAGHCPWFDDPAAFRALLLPYLT